MGLNIFCKLCYESSPAIVKATEEDKEFKEEVKEMIDGVLELIGEQQNRRCHNTYQIIHITNCVLR
jgi:meiotically up-regulated gene 157 (Mug157) protein